MKRILAVLLCAAILAGCSWEEPEYNPTGDALNQGGDASDFTQGDPEQVRVLSLAYYPDLGLNPYKCTDYTNRVLFSLLYQGLFSVSSEYEAVPILCQTYNVSANMKTYTFHIYANACFSDGSAVTAEDARASLEAAKDSPWYGKRLMHVEKITAYGNAVVVELDTPMENLPLLLDIPIVKAKQVGADHPLGSGPYQYEEDGYLRRQAGWWCSVRLAVSTDTIALVEVRSNAQIRDEFEFGSVGLVCADPGDTKYVDFRSDHELWGCENGQYLYLVCNSRSKIFGEAGLQTALTYAIDREYLAEKYYHGFARAATLPASPACPWYSQSLAEDYEYDPQKFADAVAAAELESNEVTLLLCADDLKRREVGRAIVDMLEACGLKVTVNEVSSADFTDQLRWGSYDLYLGQTKLSANMDLSAFFGTNTSMNYGGLSDPAIYAMSIEALANGGNFYNLYEMIMSEGQMCPILFQNYAVYTARGAVSDLYPARDNIFWYDLGRSLQDALITQ